MVGDGKNIYFWTFNWVLPFPLLKTLDDNQINSIDLDAKVVDFISNGSWDRTKLSSVLNSHIVDQICGIPIPSSSFEDSFIWGPSSNGIFSIKLASWLQVSNSPEHAASPILKKVWNSKMAPKIKVFAWLFLRNRLKTRERLHRFGISPTDICPVCNSCQESLSHLFTSCPAVVQAWNLINITDFINSDDIIQDLINAFTNNVFDAPKFEKTITLCWQIWQRRNNLIFRNEAFSPHAAVVTAAYFFNGSRTPNNPPPPSLLRTSSSIRWSPPPQNYVKLNFDGSVIQQSANAASGFIIRDEFGCPIFANAMKYGKSSVPIVEALALRDGLIKAKNLNFTKIIAEGDSKLVIDCVNNRFKPPWRIASIIHDIRTLASSFDDVQFFHVFREANFAANALASLSHSLSGFSYSWSHNFPPTLMSAVNFDLFGTGCSRGFSL